MRKIQQLALLMGLSGLDTPFLGASTSRKKYDFKKSKMPPKDYAKRKKRLKISGNSRNINHRIK